MLCRTQVLHTETIIKHTVVVTQFYAVSSGMTAEFLLSEIVVAVPVYIYMYGYIFTCTSFRELAFKLDKRENLNIANMSQ